MSCWVSAQSQARGCRPVAQSLDLVPSFLNNFVWDWRSVHLFVHLFIFLACFLKSILHCRLALWFCLNIYVWGGKGNSESFKCSCLKPWCLCLYLLWTYSLPLGLCFQIRISLGGMFWPTYFALQIYLAKFCRNSPTVPKLLSALLPTSFPVTFHASRATCQSSASVVKVFCHWRGSFLATGRAQRLNSPVLPVCCWLGNAACRNLG